MKEIHIGIYTDHTFGCSRYLDLIPFFNSVPGFRAEKYVPFTPYTHLIARDSAVAGQEVLFAANKGAILIRDSNLPTSSLKPYIPDTVSYRQRKSRPESFKNIVWYGGTKDLKELSKLKFLRDLSGCNLRVISDSHEEYLKVVAGIGIPTEFKAYNYATFDAELSTADLVLLPTTNSSEAHLRYMEAAVREIPVLWGKCAAYEHLYFRVMERFFDPEEQEIVGGLHPADGGSAYLDQYDLWSLGLATCLDFVEAARILVLNKDLLHTRALHWLERVAGASHA